MNSSGSGTATNPDPSQGTFPAQVITDCAKYDTAVAPRDMVAFNPNTGQYETVKAGETYYYCAEWVSVTPPPDNGNTSSINLPGTPSVITPAVIAPIADFSYQVLAGGVVQFTNASLNNPSSVIWDFGDGTTSGILNPAHKYSSGGFYSVTLTVINSSGSDTDNQVISVPIYIPQADFTYLQNGPSVQFYDLSTVKAVSWLWDFGDGSTSTSQNPFHLYADIGTYQATLTITGDNGKSYSTSQILTLSEAGGGTQTDNIIFNDTFTGTDFTPLESRPMDTGQSWYVSMNNNFLIVNNALKFNYQEYSGIYAQTPDFSSTKPVYVQWSLGSVDSKMTEVKIIFKLNGAVQETLKFTYNPTTQWQIRNGSNNLLLSGLYGDLSQNPVFRMEFNADIISVLKNGNVLDSFAYAIDYDSVSFSINLKDGYGQWQIIDNFQAGDITISPANPLAKLIADFTCTILDNNAPATVNFTDTSTGTPESWLWDFGDGSTSTSQNPSHDFNPGGVYTVRLTVINSLGSAWVTKDILIGVLPIVPDPTDPPVQPPAGDDGGTVPVAMVPGNTNIGDPKYFVVDSPNDRVLIYDKAWTYLGYFGSTGSGNGQFHTPTTLCICSSYIWVCDQGNNRIQKFNFSGVYQSQFGSTGSGNGQFNAPYGIATNCVYLYITDTGNNRVQRFAMDGTYNDQTGEYGIDFGQFNGPKGIAVDYHYIYVCDTENHRLQCFCQALEFLSAYGHKGSELTEMNRPVNIFKDDTMLYVDDSGNHRLLRFNISNNFRFQPIGYVSQELTLIHSINGVQ